MRNHYIGWWNLENLFSIEQDPDRPQWLQAALRSELRGWTAEIVERKVAQLARVISAMNNGAGPDILGVCEVENRAVLDKLVAALSPNVPRRYRIAHHNTRDQRGIDVAFIYDSQRFSTSPGEQFDRVIVKRNATRDLFQVNFTTRPGGHRLTLIGNHWPSRLGGELESEPYRILAAETLSYWVQRIGEIHADEDHEPAVLVMGDFNDEPHNRSLVDYALAERIRRRVSSTRSRKPYLLNLMWPLMGDGVGTHYHHGLPSVLDQILVNRGMLSSGAPLRVVAKSIEIVQPEFMRTAKGPRRFGRPAKRKQFDPEGFSDHYPVAVTVHERD